MTTSQPTTDIQTPQEFGGRCAADVVMFVVDDETAKTLIADAEDNEHFLYHNRVDFPQTEFVSVIFYFPNHESANEFCLECLQKVSHLRPA